MSWSKKYKKSIDCSNPKGFSQKAHCSGRKARQVGKKTQSKSVSERMKLKDYLPNIELGKVYSDPYATAFKPVKEENSVNEMQVVNKKTGKDITKHVLDLLSGKIDKKKFEKLTGLKKESVNEVDDHEVGMGLSSLKSSVRSAKIIYDNIKKRNIEELEGWVQEKLTLASDYLKNVADYMEDLDEYDKDGTSNN